MSRFVFVAAIPVILCLYPVVAYSQTAEDCTRIENAVERLACFDSVFESVGQTVRNAEQSAASKETPVQPTLAAPTLAPSQAPQSEASSTASQREASFGLEQTERRAPRKPDTLEEIQSTIAALRRKDRQELIFLLENDQIWIQDVHRNMTAEVGDRVTIRRGRMGGYILTVDGGASSRVVRIK